ncbi:MAG: ACT domain-containing protein, partial [Actinomycetota bacterium]
GALGREPLIGASGADVVRRRTAAVDRAIAALAPATDGLAVVAVGGYGRAELAPGSDVDLLILHSAGDHAEAEDAFAPILYALWDVGVEVGHAVRTPEECLTEAEQRLDSMTALLDARVVTGSGGLAAEMLSLLRASIGADPAWLLDELRASLVVREARFGALGETLEPNVRDSVGGLREVQLFGWLAAGLDDELGARGWLRRSEANAVAGARDFLLLVRAGLHHAAGGRADQLLFEHQDAVAAALGFRDGEAEPPVVWEARDVFMRRVFLAGRAVRAAAQLCLERVGAERLGRVRHRVSFDADLSAGRVLDGFAQVAESGGSVAPSDLDRIETWSEARGAAEPWTDGMRAAFTRILAAGDGGADALGTLDLLGVVERLVPEWDHVRARAQRDPFHRSPADTHLVRTAAQLAHLLFRPDVPMGPASVAAIDDPGPLLIGAVLHDIGKVGSGGHVQTGAELAGAITGRMGLPPPDRELVRFLVEHHLLLSDTATRRNLEDEDLILQTATMIGSPDRLAALYLLTLADAQSTGPAASTPWRLGLIRELVAKVAHVFERGEATAERSESVEAMRARIRSALSGRPPELIDGFLANLTAAYFTSVQPEEAVLHFDLVAPRPGRHEARTHHRPGRAPGVHSLAVGCVDRHGLLASIAGALTLSGLSVLSARAFTTDDGVAIDSFDVAGAFEPDISEERWRRFRTTLRHALEGRIDVADRVRTLRSHYRPARSDVPITVRVDQDASDAFTVVEVGAADRLGLLFDLARTFADRGLDVHLAKVATYGPRVVDVFYVATDDGRKVAEAETAGLVTALTAAADRR